MGGWDTMITPSTKNVLVEAAWFDPATREIVGLLSVWGTDAKGAQGWILHETRMPAALSPP